MKRLALAMCLTAFTSAGFAQQAPQAPQGSAEFVPFTVQKADLDKLRTWLEDQPLKFGIPVLNWVASLEQRAIAEQAKGKPETK